MASPPGEIVGGFVTATVLTLARKDLPVDRNVQQRSNSACQGDTVARCNAACHEANTVDNTTCQRRRGEREETSVRSRHSFPASCFLSISCSSLLECVAGWNVRCRGYSVDKIRKINTRLSRIRAPIGIAAFGPRGCLVLSRLNSVALYGVSYDATWSRKVRQAVELCGHSLAVTPVRSAARQERNDTQKYLARTGRND